MTTEIRRTTYTPTEDVIEPLRDGAGRVVVARAGVPMTWGRALMLGLVTDSDAWEQIAEPASEAPAVSAPPALPAHSEVRRGRS